MNEPIKTKLQTIAVMTFIGFVLANVLFANQQEQGYRQPTKDIISTDTITTGETEKRIDNEGLQSGNKELGGSKQENRYPIQTTPTIGRENKQTKVLNQVGVQYTIIHKGFATGDIRQEYINYAYKIGGENLMYLIMCENGGLDLDLQSRVQQSYGREESYGLCQLGLPRKGVDKKRFLTDYKYQLDTCWKYRESGSPFYGPTRMVKGEKCYVWASKQVLIKKI